MTPLGSLSWSRRNGGRLGVKDRFVLLSAAVRSRLRRALLPRAGPRPEDYARLELESLRLPDSPAVAQALGLCEEAYEPWLLNHCLRTYLWSGLVGQLERVRVDLEELAVASLLHDIGLTRRAKTEIDSACFAVRGGLFAEKTLLGQGRPALAAAVADGICMHLNVAVAATQPALNYLLHQGAAIDVVGRDVGKVRPMRSQVLAKHPRLDFKSRLVSTLAQEAREHPGTRLALMLRFGFLGFIKSSPYAD